MHMLYIFLCLHCNSATIQPTSGPATIKCLNSHGSAVNPTDPPDSLTVAVFAHGNGQ